MEKLKVEFWDEKPKMKGAIDKGIYVLVSENGAMGIAGFELFKNHLLEVCPCFKKELKAIFEDKNKGLREINEILFKINAMVFFSPDIFHFSKHWGMRRLDLSGE